MVKDQVNEAENIQFIDDQGSTVQVSSQRNRFIGLAPSVTEMLATICPDSQIIGRTQNCDYPSSILSKKIVNNYPIDFEALLQLNPDVIFALDGINSAPDILRLRELGLTVYVLKTTSIDSVIFAMNKIGAVSGNVEKSKEEVMKLQLAIDGFKNSNPTTKEDSRSFLALASVSPIYVFGQNTLFSEKLRLIGHQNAVKEVLSSPYPELNSEYILTLNPDVLLGGSFEMMDSTFFTIYPMLKNINAYKTKQVYKVSDDLMSRPNPRIPESLAELQRIAKMATKENISEVKL